jgi:hypothetical protein
MYSTWVREGLNTVILLQHFTKTSDHYKLVPKISISFIKKHTYTFLHSWCLSVYIKVTFTLKQDMKAQRGSRGVAVLFLQPWCYMGWVVNTTPWPLYPPTPRRIPWYLLYRRWGGPQGRFGWVQKTSFPMEFKPLAVKLIAHVFSYSCVCC